VKLSIGPCSKKPDSPVKCRTVLASPAAATATASAQASVTNAGVICAAAAVFWAYRYARRRGVGAAYGASARVAQSRAKLPTAGATLSADRRRPT